MVPGLASKFLGKATGSVETARLSRKRAARSRVISRARPKPRDALEKIIRRRGRWERSIVILPQRQRREQDKVCRYDCNDSRTTTSETVGPQILVPDNFKMVVGRAAAPRMINAPSDRNPVDEHVRLLAETDADDHRRFDPTSTHRVVKPLFSSERIIIPSHVA